MKRTLGFFLLASCAVLAGCGATPTAPIVSPASIAQVSAVLCQDAAKAEPFIVTVAPALISHNQSAIALATAVCATVNGVPAATPISAATVQVKPTGQ